MVDDTLEDAGSRPDFGRPKRPPPTIDLKATEVSSETKPGPEPQPEPVAEAKSDSTIEDTADDAAPAPQPETVMPPPAARAASKPVSPWVIAPFSGAVAAALVIGVRLDAGLAAGPARIDHAVAIRRRNRRSDRPRRRARNQDRSRRRSIPRSRRGSVRWRRRRPPRVPISPACTRRPTSSQPP